MTLEYLMKLDAGAFDGPMTKARGGLRGAKSDADALNQSVGGLGKQGGSSGGLGLFAAGMTAAAMTSHKSAGIFTTLFRSVEGGIGRIARVGRVAGGGVQLGAMFARQIPGLARFKDGLKSVEDRAHALNRKLETLSHMGAQSGGVMGGLRFGGPSGPAAGAAAGGAAGGSMLGFLNPGTLATVAVLGTGLAGVFGSIKAINTAANMETIQTAFATLVGDAMLAKTVLGDIKKLANETPFEFPELANAGRMLVAFGEAARDVPETLRRIGDVASGVAAPIGELAEIYGKARTQNQLFAEDINQLTGRGIPIIKEFAKILGKPESEIKKLAEEGKITFPLLDQAFRNMTASGGQFYQMMQQQSATTKGMLSTLGDAVNDLFLEFGKPLNDAIKPILQDAISLAGQLAPMAQAMGQHMGAALSAVRDFVAEARDGSGLAAKMGEAMWASIKGFGEQLMKPLAALWAGVSSIGSDLLAALTPTMDWLMAKMAQAGHALIAAISGGLAEVMAELPMGLGKGGAAKLNQRAAEHGVAADIAGFGADQKAAEAGGAWRAMGGSLDKARGRASDKWSEVTKPQDLPGGTLPMSPLDRGYNPLFPNGVVPQGFKGKDTLPPSALNGPANALAAVLGTPAARSTDPLSGGEAPGAKAAIKGAAPAGVKVDEKAKQQAKGAAGPAILPLAVKQAMQTDPSSGTPSSDAGMGKRMMGGRDQGPLSGRRSNPIPSRMMGSGLDAFMRDQQRDGTAATAFGRGGLSMRGPVKLPSPGTAKRQQDRREAAATAARSGGGGHPLASSIKAIEAKLNTLAVAS